MTVAKRPKYLNLMKISLPIPGLVSIAHRLSGILLFFAIPLSAFLLDLSTQSPAGYQQAVALLAHPVMKLALIILAWSICHHLYAGIRYLLIDVDIGVELTAARRSAMIVMTLGVLSALIFLAVIL